LNVSGLLLALGPQFVPAKMRVRITAQPTQTSVDGISLSGFKPGSVYSLPASLATLLIVEGWAEPMSESGDSTLPPITFTLFPRPERRRRTLTPLRLRAELGIAADRRRRRN
jgi:hypothetical protein